MSTGPRAGFKGLGREIVRALVVETVKAGVIWLIAAGLAVVVPTVVSMVSHGAGYLVVVGVGTGALMLIPPFVGFRRSRTRRQLAEQAAANKQLVAQAAQDERADEVLADWLAGALVDPYRLLGSDGDRNFENWLNETVFRVLSVVFDDQCVTGMAIVRQHDNHYEITHRSAGVPEAILGLDPSPVYRPLDDCIREHAPNARVFWFRCEEELTWVAFFPEHPFIPGVHSSRLKSVAATVGHIYRVLIAAS